MFLALLPFLVEIRLRFCFESLSFLYLSDGACCRIASRVCHVAFATYNGVSFWCCSNYGWHDTFRATFVRSL